MNASDSPILAAAARLDAAGARSIEYEEAGPLPFGEWCIVEMFGHRRLAGYVTADGPIMTATRLRVDIYPGLAESPSMTQFVSYPAAVYCLTATTEQIARAVAARDGMVEPVARWELEQASDAFG